MNDDRYNAWCDTYLSYDTNMLLREIRAHSNGMCLERKCALRARVISCGASTLTKLTMFRMLDKGGGYVQVTHPDRGVCVGVLQANTNEVWIGM